MMRICGTACAGGKESKVGIVHNVMRYEPLRPRALSINWVGPVVEWLNRVRRPPQRTCQGCMRGVPKAMQCHASSLFSQLGCLACTLKERL